MNNCLDVVAFTEKINKIVQNARSEMIKEYEQYKHIGSIYYWVDKNGNTKTKLSKEEYKEIFNQFTNIIDDRLKQLIDFAWLDYGIVTSQDIIEKIATERKQLLKKKKEEQKHLKQNSNHVAHKFNVGDIVKFNDGETFEGESIDDAKFIILEIYDDSYYAEELDENGNQGGGIEILFEHDNEYPCEDRMHKIS